MNERYEVKLPFYARLAGILLCVALITEIMSRGKAIIIPLFFSVLISLMLLPLTKLLERLRLPRGLAAILSVIVFVLFISSIFYFLGAQVVQFSKDLPQLGDRLQEWTDHLRQWVAVKYHVDASQQLQYLNNATEYLVRNASVVAQSLVLSVAGFAIWTIFVFVFTFFMLTHRTLLQRFIICLFSRENQPKVGEVMTETRLLANSYVLGLLTEMVIVAVLNCVAFLVFGVKYALLLGVLAAVMNIIPYLGIWTAAAIAGLITLSNSTPGHALSVVIILIVVHFIDANVLLPRIVGRRVNMNPLITIVAVLTGELLWGIPGMFLFIPLAGILKIIFERVEGLKPWAILMGTEREAKGD
jgi:predicted PurR-regulated permease PerM